MRSYRSAERRARELDEVPYTAIKGENASCESAFRSGSAVPDFNLHVAKHVSTVGHAGGAHSIGDQDDAFWILGFKVKADHEGINVDAVANNFGEERALVENVRGDAWIAVIDCAHSVESVGGRTGSCDKAGFSVDHFSVAMPHAAAHSEGGGMCDEFGCAREFRGNRHEGDLSFSGLPEAVKKRNRGGFKESFSVDATLEMGQKRAFEMDAKGSGAMPGGFSALLDLRGNAAQCAEGIGFGRSDRRRKVGADTAAREIISDGVKSFWGGLHDVVSCAAVNMDVNVRGNKGSFGKVVSRGDPALLRGSEAFNSIDAAVF